MSAKPTARPRIIFSCWYWIAGRSSQQWDSATALLILDQDAIDILQPMTKDGTDFVRQGAYIALGMILVEQSEASCPALAPTRLGYTKVVSNKHEDPMARFGAVLGQGLIDAGGRNVTISLQSRAGSRNTNAIVGMVLFCQFWYWYPLAHCASLAFVPTGIIGLDDNLKAPKFEFVSNARPSLFAYPSATKPPKKEAVTKVATAVLSTTAKAKAREKKKAAAEGEGMDVVSVSVSTSLGVVLTRDRTRRKAMSR